MTRPCCRWFSKRPRAARKNCGSAALGVLKRLGNVSCVPVLLDAAAESDAELAQAAKTVLARLPGKDVDADLLARLPQATGKTAPGPYRACRTTGH